MDRQYRILLIVAAALVVFFGVQAQTRLAGLRRHAAAVQARLDALLDRRATHLPAVLDLVAAGGGDPAALGADAAAGFHAWQQAGTAAARLQAAAELEGRVARLLAAADLRPDLAEDPRLVKLREERLETDPPLEMERRRHTEAVREYAAAARRFPTVAFAWLFGRRAPRAYFDPPPAPSNNTVDK